MELTAVAQLRRMVLEHLSRYTWNDSLIDHVYDILQEVRDDTPRYRCCVYKGSRCYPRYAKLDGRYLL